VPTWVPCLPSSRMPNWDMQKIRWRRG
jgi:hypothetical protein